eukprot:1144270-Pelagomonas_calceolata.AAC.8
MAFITPRNTQSLPVPLSFVTPSSVGNTNLSCVQGGKRNPGGERNLGGEKIPERETQEMREAQLRRAVQLELPVESCMLRWKAVLPVLVLASNGTADAKDNHRLSSFEC